MREKGVSPIIVLLIALFILALVIFSPKRDIIPKVSPTPTPVPTPTSTTLVPKSAKTCGPPITYSVFKDNGWAVDWSHTLNTVAFNRKGADGYYHIILDNPNGSNERQFGQNTPNFPKKTVGTPVFSPDGKYIVFVAEKEAHEGTSDAATPGWGGYSDLWIARSDGSRVWQLTNTPNTQDGGTILGVFSPNGKYLEWTERTKAPNYINLPQTAGYWVIKVANFIDSAAGPALTNIRTFSPGGDFFNETGGFSPDSSNFLITSDYTTNNFWANQIFKVDLGSGNLTQLTTDGYNEHPRYTPDGRILWMSSSGQCLFSCGTDWWIMNPDGSSKTRLTYLNDKTNPEYFQKQGWTGVVETENWSSDGSYFYGDTLTNLLTNSGEILKVNLTCK